LDRKRKRKDWEKKRVKGMEDTKNGPPITEENEKSSGEKKKMVFVEELEDLKDLKLAWNQRADALQKICQFRPGKLEDGSLDCSFSAKMLGARLAVQVPFFRFHCSTRQHHLPQHPTTTTSNNNTRLQRN
jgi:hypothetical protein